MMTAPMSALALVVFMTTWDSHLWPLLVGNDDAHKTLPVGLAAMQADNAGATGIPMLMAAAVMAVLPTLLLFCLLTAYYPFRRQPGEVMILFMMCYAVHRFLNEMLRNDTDPVALGMTLSQNGSILVFAAALLLFGTMR